MHHTYGFLKSTVLAVAPLRGKPVNAHETQYHVHATLASGNGDWDAAINVGTSSSADVLLYKILEDFVHPLTALIAAAPAGFSDLTGSAQLPALDFQRSDLLAQTGDWTLGDVMDGATDVAPVAALVAQLQQAKAHKLDICVFGRSYTDGTNGIHDVHMNQGSRKPFLNDGTDNQNDHNDVWQDGAVLIRQSDGTWWAYFTAFAQQQTPSDALGNPAPGSHPMGATDL